MKRIKGNVSLFVNRNQQTRSPPHLASILSKVVSRAKESVQLSKALVDAMLLDQLHDPGLQYGRDEWRHESRTCACRSAQEFFCCYRTETRVTAVEKTRGKSQWNGVERSRQYKVIDSPECRGIGTPHSLWTPLQIGENSPYFDALFVGCEERCY